MNYGILSKATTENGLMPKIKDLSVMLFKDLLLL